MKKVFISSVMSDFKEYRQAAGANGRSPLQAKNLMPEEIKIVEGKG
jgi:hypothetical protein